MSVTTTDNPLTSTLHRDYLHDYNIRLTGGIDNGPSRNPTDAPLPPVDNPDGWDDRHRQVPPYRPINRNLDLSDRPWGANQIETGFVILMMHGCWLQGISSWLWRSTGGKVNDTFWRYKVGGEI